MLDAPAEAGRLLSPDEVDEARELIRRLLDGLGTAILGQQQLLELDYRHSLKGKPDGLEIDIDPGWAL